MESHQNSEKIRERYISFEELKNIVGNKDKTRDEKRKAFVDFFGKRKKEEENDWVSDPEVQEFLENADKPGPWSEEDDKIYTVGGLSADKNRNFMKFQNKINNNENKKEKKNG